MTGYLGVIITVSSGLLLARMLLRGSSPIEAVYSAGDRGGDQHLLIGMC